MGLLIGFAEIPHSPPQRVEERTRWLPARDLTFVKIPEGILCKGDDGRQATAVRKVEIYDPQQPEAGLIDYEFWCEDCKARMRKAAQRDATRIHQKRNYLGVYAEVGITRTQAAPRQKGPSVSPYSPMSVHNTGRRVAPHTATGDFDKFTNDLEKGDR